MTTWTNDELNRFGTSEEVQLASLRGDGTLRKPVTIWIVRVGDELYVRSVKGRDGTWFRWTQVRHAGQIKTGSLEKDVSFEEGDPTIYDQVDAAYRSKYRRYAKYIVNSVLTPHARTAAIKLVPR